MVGVLWASLACGLGARDEDAVRFAEPFRYSVRQGDDIVKVAMRFSVTVEDVIAWNGLMDARLEDGQVLFLWPHAELLHSEDPVAAAPRPRNAGRGGASGGQGSGRAAGSGAPSPTAEELPPVDEAVGGGVVVVLPRVPVRRAGLLGVDVGGSDLDLAEAASGLQRTGGLAQEGSGLGSRSGSLGGGGRADGLEIRAAAMRDLGPRIPNTPVTPPQLARPAPKACLRGAASEVSEQGVVQNAGLNSQQVKAGMATVARALPRCFPAGTEGTYQLVLEVTVGCDGRVSNTYTVSPGVVPSHVTSCLERTVGFASFAAHGLPDGAAFQYPMTFTF